MPYAFCRHRTTCRSNLYEQLSPNESPPIHVHYHWLLNAGECDRNPMFDGRLRLPGDVLAWLKKRVPLAVPTGDGFV